MSARVSVALTSQSNCTTVTSVRMTSILKRIGDSSNSSCINMTAQGNIAPLFIAPRSWVVDLSVAFEKPKVDSLTTPSASPSVFALDLLAPLLLAALASFLAAFLILAEGSWASQLQAVHSISLRCSTSMDSPSINSRPPYLSANLRNWLDLAAIDQAFCTSRSVLNPNASGRQFERSA